MAKNLTHTKISEIENSSRIPQIRAARQSKIAKPGGTLGTKSSALPKSLSNEAICKASNLVKNTTKTLFQSRLGKPPESKAKVDVLPKQLDPTVPVTQNSTFAISRPMLARSDTFNKETTTVVPQNVDNLTQNVINKLQEQTFVASKPPIRMSISPIAPPSAEFAVPRPMSGVQAKKLASHICSTPFRDSPIAKFSTRNTCHQQMLPPISFDITGTDPVASTQFMDNTGPSMMNRTDLIADTTEPSFLPFANLSPIDGSVSAANIGVHNMTSPFENIADTTAPSFLAQCTPSVRGSKQKIFSAEVSTAENDISVSNSNENDESTIRSTTMMLCLGDNSRHEQTLVPLVPNGGEVMEIDGRRDMAACVETNSSSTPIDMPNKQRFSFGQDITEWTLDCSIELCDSSVGSSAANVGSPSNMKKQHSFDEKSLSILTPDQMKEFLDSNNTNLLNLDLPLFPKMTMHQCRIDQTPSPEELPLDPIGVKTDLPDMSILNDNQTPSGYEQQLSQTDSYSKTDQMTKSAASKVSNSFITSVTSITSLDTGYQGDGEMSRPASRGGDHSPSNMPRIHSMRPMGVNNNQNNIAIVRRQDPMTDSDFFTESDADDVVNRGDRRAQVIDGQLYGAPMMVQDANVNHYVNQQPSTEDSCMESSGIFTDVENRGDDELMHRNGVDSDMSPDGSTDTIKSSNTEYNNKKNSTVIQAHTDKTTFVNNHQGHSMSDSTTSTINSSCEKEQKQNKNEANVALKKHEMSKSKRLSGGDKLKNPSSSGVLSSVDIENQENKRPTTGGGSSSARKVVPNKWDAVMNKIASNKTNVKSKNYNEVKSKVTCGIRKKDSPGLYKSPSTADCDVFVATSTTRNHLLSSKRGRTHSQQSSQSDISEHVGSSATKTRANSSSSPRAAKKRDVRAIISPNDLAANKSNGSLKPISLQKRFSNGSSSGVSSSPTDQKSSPPPKKFLSKRSTPSASSKTPLKEHNRLVGSGTPTTTTTTILQATPRKTDTKPRGTISPKTTKRVILSHTSPHSLENNNTTATHHTSDIVHSERIFNNKTNANQINRIVNNSKIDNCLNGIGATRNVISATKATSTVHVVDENLIHANKGVEALSVVVKYLVDDLGAFNTPNLKNANEELGRVLLETKVQLDNARQSCTILGNQLAEKDKYLKNRELEIEAHYKGELSKLENRYGELDEAYKARVASLELEISTKEREHREQLHAIVTDKDAELARAKIRENDLSQQIKTLSSTENELREKVLASETEFSERLQLAAMRERELTEKFTTLNKGLSEQLSSANNEILVLRTGKPITLEDEIQSWRTVTELKQKEISELKKRNHELEISAAALPGALSKNSVLESRLEDLQIQLKNKTDDVQELLKKNKHLEQSYKQEMKNRSVVALDNEQLKYRLKTNTEKYSSALIEMVKQNESSTLSDNSLMDTVFWNDVSSSSTTSPPTTPVVKGVVEKNDSVSYVLELNDDESPKSLASRIIRRAGSFRQNDRNRLVSLTQSASATSVLRQVSETSTPRSHLSTSRTRSKSVSTTNNSSNSHDEKPMETSYLSVPQSHKPLSTSSPNTKRSIQTANNSNENDLLLSEESETECSLVSRPNADKVHFRRSNSYKHTKRGLITCSTAALTSQRPDLFLSLPVHPTVKELKKFQQIKESAGEAMVSGTNSEDEASTASSDGSLSSRSSSSGRQRRRSSLEDGNIDKIGTSLGAGNDDSRMGPVGTPMEVSWSDDVDSAV